jgi:hypothetical protein
MSSQGNADVRPPRNACAARLCYSRGVPAPTFDPAERAREKQLSRDQDERDLASGAKTREQLRRENAFVHPCEFRVRLDLCERLS